MATTIELDSDEALVLLDFALRFAETDELKILHRAEKVALWNFGCLLEKQSLELFDEAYRELLDAARERLAPSDPDAT